MELAGPAEYIVFSGGGVDSFWTDSGVAIGGLPNFTLPTEATAAAAGRPTAVAASVFVLMAAIALLGLAGNSLVVVVTIVDHDLKEHVSNIIIGNLALADLSACLLVVVPAAVSLLVDRWPFGHLCCRLHCGFNYLFIIVSMMSLALVSVDRKSAVEEPLQYIRRSNPSRLLAPLLLIWSTGALFAVAPIALDWVQYDYWEGVCAIGWFQHRGTGLYVIVAFCVCFLVPASLIVWSNHGIVRTSHRVSRRHGAPSKTGDATSTLQHNSLSVSRLYSSMRVRGARAARMLRGLPRTRVMTTSLRAVPEVASGVSDTALRRSRSEPRRSRSESRRSRQQLDVSELVSGPHNIESMFSEFGDQRRRRSRRSPRGGGATERDLSDPEPEVSTVHLPEEQRRRSDLQPVIDALRAWRPAAEAGMEQEVTIERTSAGNSSNSSSSDCGGDGGGGGTTHANPLSDFDSSGATDGAPRGRAKIILCSQSSVVAESVPQELPRLAVEVAQSLAAESDSAGGTAAGRQLPSAVADGPDQSQFLRPTETNQPLPLTTEQERHLIRSHRRIIRSISIVVAIFFVCMTPFCVTKLVKIIFLREDLVPGWLNLLASVVQFMSSATNPFIYGFFRPDFKRAFMRIYRKVKGSLDLQCR